ncbi:MAG: hypothetical protein AB7I25_01690 [Vicinamibacterales bacterium]
MPNPLLAVRNLTLKHVRRAQTHALRRWNAAVDALADALPKVRLAWNLLLKQARRAQNRARHSRKVIISGVKDAKHAVGRLRESVSNRTVNAWKGVYRAVRKPLRARRDRQTKLREQAGWNRTEWQIERELAELLDGEHPVIVGPWLAEVGFEALYWIPFLRWVSAAYQLDSKRVTVLTRGGAGLWYSDVASRSIELWDLITPEEFARRNAERGELKQMSGSSLESDLIAAAAREGGLTGARVLHPSLMFRLFRLFWSGHRASGFLDSHTRFALHAPPGVLPRSSLPASYVAVKFYAARSMPDTPEVRRTLHRMVRELAGQTTVVLLDTGLAIDDHADYVFGGDPRIVSAREWLTPRTNLAAQTDIIAHASAYVGTCGSLTWLAPFLGVPTSAVLADPAFLHAHLSVALRACHRLPGAARFSPVDLRGLDPLTTLTQ